MPARRLPAASRRAGVLSVLAVLPTRLLIANRGEIAIRIARAAAELEIPTVAVFSTDDAGSLHARRAADARSLAGSGPAAYLDQAGLIAVAGEAGCDALHPGYGFLSENAAFARRCAEAGLCFVGPRPEVLELFGDKARARALAVRCGVPVLAGTSVVEAADDVRAFLASLGAGGVAVLKAVAGGGGRGMRVVRHADEVDDAWARCRSEALQAFGSGDLYVERLLPRARHVEVQVVGERSRCRDASLGARVHAAAPASEAGRAGAQPRTCRRRCGRACSTPRCGWPRRSASTISGPSSS